MRACVENIFMCKFTNGRQVTDKLLSKKLSYREDINSPTNADSVIITILIATHVRLRATYYQQYRFVIWDVNDIKTLIIKMGLIKL